MAHPPADGVQVTWIGHATCLVQMDGVAFFTDPVFAERASPVRLFWKRCSTRSSLAPHQLSFAGAKRYVPTPFNIKAIQSVIKIDFAVISHNHYDHLDISTVYELGDSIKWFVPLGLKTWFTSCGVQNCVELDWCGE